MIKISIVNADIIMRKKKRTSKIRGASYKLAGNLQMGI